MTKEVKKKTNSRRPNKNLKESMRRSAISKAYKKELVSLTYSDCEKEEEYSHYKRGLLSCERDIIEARETGNMKFAHQAAEDKDYIKKSYSEHPDFAERYEKEHELEYGLYTNEALNYLSDGNKEKYDELFAKAQDVAQFIEPPQRLMACNQRVSEERRGMLIEEMGNAVLAAKHNAPALHSLRLYDGAGR